MQTYLISNFLDVFALLLELKTLDMAELSPSRNEAGVNYLLAIR
jgi:hypothetical protein